jgi:hypothetical protein
MAVTNRLFDKSKTLAFCKCHTCIECRSEYRRTNRYYIRSLSAVSNSGLDLRARLNLLANLNEKE